jgi:hypothetical protein
MDKGTYMQVHFQLEKTELYKEKTIMRTEENAEIIISLCCIWRKEESSLSLWYTIGKERRKFIYKKSIRKEFRR